ncbi:UNVERIFIED_CONTAM: hypothetical protein HDU68_006148 [Siphonaria sp. JEL0065]|nr:hypothetical protein HDU68_006148 [Siphonaria sp. JEL0065]
MNHVATPYVFACQHDWRLNEKLEISGFLNLMERECDMNYLGFISRRSANYHAVAVHGRGLPDALVDPPLDVNIPLCRSYFWFDKNHIARTAFYQNTVFAGGFKFKRGDFIEDTMGHQMMNEIKEGGLDAWKRWGAYLYYPNLGKTNSLVHVNGRQYLTDEDRLNLAEASRRANKVTH